MKFVYSTHHYKGSHGIEPTRDLTHFLKIGFVVAMGGGFLQCIKLHKKRKNVKEISFMHNKTFTTIFKNGLNPVLGSILRLPV